MPIPEQIQQLLQQLGVLLPAVQDLLAQLRALLDPLTMLRRAVGMLVEPLSTFMQGYLFSTTDVIGGGDFTSAAAITRIEPYMAAIADSGLVAALIWASFHMMWSRSARSLYSVRNVLPRALLAIILINFALPLFQAAVEAENAVSRAIESIPLGFSWSGNLWAAVSGSDPGGVPTFTMLTLAALYAGYVVLALAYAIRYALLVALAVTAPIAALLFVLPDTAHFAREWASLLVTTLFMQPLQLLILAIGFELENDIVGHATLTPIRHVFALACLLLVFRVPGALGSTSRIGTHAIGTVKHFATLALHPRHVA